MGMYGLVSCFVLVRGGLKDVIKKWLADYYDDCSIHSEEVYLKLMDNLLVLYNKSGSSGVFYFNYGRSIFKLVELDEECSLFVVWTTSKKYSKILKYMRNICHEFQCLVDAYPLSKSKIYGYARWEENDLQDNELSNCKELSNSVPEWASKYVTSYKLVTGESSEKLPIMGIYAEDCFWRYSGSYFNFVIIKENEDVKLDDMESIVL